LQQFLLHRLQVGEKANLFQDIPAQQLAFIYDQDRCRAFAITADEVLVELNQQRALVLIGDGEAEIRCEILQELKNRKPGVEDVTKSNSTFVEPLQSALDQESFAGSHLARHHDKPFALLDSVQQAGPCLVVQGRGIKEGRIGVDLKRVFRETVEL